MEAKRVPLGLLNPGDAARVLDVIGEGAFRRRLLDMGFVKGAFVRVIKHAPFKNPIEYCIGGTHVTLRTREAMHILVEQVPVPEWCRKRPPFFERRLRHRTPGKGRRWRRGKPSR